MASLLRLPPALLESPVLRLRPLPLLYRQARFCSSHSSPRPPPSAAHPPTLRFAPSPTGYLHLGGLRTALFNHLLARKLGGKWLLRIEDTDQTRYVEGAVESLLRTLKWAGLDFDEGPGKDGGNGPYFQSQRKEIYDAHLQPLIDQGRAYHCFCTPERLAETRKLLQKRGDNSTYDRRCLGLGEEEVKSKLERGEKSVVRFKSSSEGLTQQDLIYSSIHYPSLPIEDFVLRKSDGLPTYHFANVVDDSRMGVDVVLRGEEWLPSTPKHLALYRALSLPPPSFGHMPLLINPDGSKLSKRAGDVRVEDYIAKGYEPEALLNFVALLGWSPQGGGGGASAEAGGAEKQLQGQETDVLSLEEMVEQFSLPAINKNRSTLSPTKLLFLNRAHLQRKLAEGADAEKRRELSERCARVVGESFGVGNVEEGTLEAGYVGRVLEALKERIHTINDVPNLGASFFLPPNLDSPSAKQLYKSVKPEAYRSSLTSSFEIIASLPEEAFASPTHEAILDPLNELVKTRGKGPKEVMAPLRHGLTGVKVGAGVPATIAVLGRERTVARLKEALRRSEEGSL
ncbi:hypothetical protein BCR35DRAFT_294367 [Leucosporidium creatinivorum]|uniref:Glutamate--tRNA ligase, mitochondrial n=1 Tax=Leucosporidium creatinivorum TaxID=106004 RepID=A0A1Y2EGR0_9BASI|nr:hypothetical protein BCR35DRAFT_294367 [Leucosporidium creatinivorum]